AARGAPGAAAGRAVRRARLDHARLDAGVARRPPRRRAAGGRAGGPPHPKGAPPCGPGGRDVAPPPARRGGAARAVPAAAQAPRDGHGRRLRRAAPARAGGARAMKRYLPAALLLVLFVAAWQGVASLHSVDNLTLASPAETWDALRHDHGLLLS